MRVMAVLCQLCDIVPSMYYDTNNLFNIVYKWKVNLEGLTIMSLLQRLFLLSYMYIHKIKELSETHLLRSPSVK